MPHGKQWFFGVGISEYVEFPNLCNAVKDVTDISELLFDDYGFLPEHAVTLFNDQATKENIINELDEFVAKVDEEDSLLVYFAGHGHMISKTQRGFWIPGDAKRNSTSRYLRNSTIRDYLKDIHSKHTLIIADSCFSGSLFVRGASRSSAALHDLELIPSRWAICSGRHDEQVSDGNPGENSPFAQSILDSLRSNKRPLFNVSRLIERVVEQTRSNYKQLPEGNPVQDAGHQGGQYMFHLTAREEKFWEECQRYNTVRYYSQYLRQFPNGKHRSGALSRIRALEDEVAWRLAEKSNIIFAFYNYIGRDSDGKYIKDAEERISILENIEASLSDPEPPSTEENNLANIETSTEQREITTLEFQEIMDAKKESGESSLEAYQKEVNSRLFVETKKESLFSLKISIIFYVIAGFILYLYVSKVVSEGMVWTIVILGYMLYQIEGILFSIKSYHIGFKGGTHAGYLLPIFTFFAWLVGTFFIEVNSSGIFMPFASLGPMIVSILGRRYIVIAAQKKWVSAEDL